MTFIIQPEAPSLCFLCNRPERSHTGSAARSVKHRLDKPFDWSTLTPRSSLHFLGLNHSTSSLS